MSIKNYNSSNNYPTHTLLNICRIRIGRKARENLKIAHSTVFEGINDILPPTDPPSKIDVGDGSEAGNFEKINSARCDCPILINVFHKCVKCK